jgi:hypothetical protein
LLTNQYAAVMCPHFLQVHVMNPVTPEENSRQSSANCDLGAPHLGHALQPEAGSGVIAGSRPSDDVNPSAFSMAFAIAFHVTSPSAWPDFAIRAATALAWAFAFRPNSRIMPRAMFSLATSV